MPVYPSQKGERKEHFCTFAGVQVNTTIVEINFQVS